MKLGESLAGVTALGVETAPFIYFVERHARYTDLVHAIFDRADRGEIQIITSVITLLEVLVLPIEAGQRELQEQYRAMLLDTLHVVAVPVSAVIAEQAAILRAAYRLRTPDALHIATALSLGCDAFVTNDHALKRVREIRVIVLDELESD